MKEAIFRNRALGVDAILRERIEGEWYIAEYDSHLGHYCGSHTYNTKADALAWLERSGFELLLAK
jgi:hypothetical protein